MPSSFLDELAWRGLIQQVTDQPALDAHLSGSTPAARKAYVGFDPTADSLTIGNLVGIMALARFQRHGHCPVALMGGGTGLIGDPSGKSAERQLNTPEVVAANVKEIRTIFDRFLDFSPGKSQAVMPDNIDWLAKLGYLELLRDVGKHFSVNMMIQKDSVKSRLEGRDHGISYTEFSYMILQAYDYAHLHRIHGVTLQMGGSDQYGNIVVGMDLIKKMSGSGGTGVPPVSPPGGTGVPPVSSSDAPDSPPAFGLVWPLVTKADGTKFGKTESGAIWLTAPKGPNDKSPARTSAYAYYQFWLNAADADAVRFLKIYTHLSREDITALEHSLATDPSKREAQRALAHHATELLHGPTERERAQHAAQALFSGELNKLDEALLDEVLASAPSTNHDKQSLSADGGAGVAGIPLVDLLAQTTLAKSKSEARTLLAQGSISVNGHKAAPDARVSLATLLHGRIIALRRGGKTWHITRWS